MWPKENEALGPKFWLTQPAESEGLVAFHLKAALRELTLAFNAAESGRDTDEALGVALALSHTCAQLQSVEIMERLRQREAEGE